MALKFTDPTRDISFRLDNGNQIANLLSKPRVNWYSTVWFSSTGFFGENRQRWWRHHRNIAVEFQEEGERRGGGSGESERICDSPSRFHVVKYKSIRTLKCIYFQHFPRGNHLAFVTEWNLKFMLEMLDAPSWKMMWQTTPKWIISVRHFTTESWKLEWRFFFGSFFIICGLRRSQSSNLKNELCWRHPRVTFPCYFETIFHYNNCTKQAENNFFFLLFVSG